MDALNPAAPSVDQDMVVELPQTTAAIDACCIYEVLIKLMIGKLDGCLWLHARASYGPGTVLRQVLPVMLGLTNPIHLYYRS